MSRNWLYPISATAGRRFVDEDHDVPVSFEAFRDLVVTGKIKDRWWYLTTNFHNVEVGDLLWVYTGEHDLGVVGVGRIDEIVIDPPEVRWTLDRKVTEMLCQHPFPASRIRRDIHYPRAAVAALDPHAQLMRELQTWTRTAADSSARRLGKIGLAPRRTVHRRGQPASSAVLAHDQILVPVTTLFLGAGWDVGGYDVKPVRMDLAARHPARKSVVIVEAKQLPRTGPGRDDVRTAIGQLLEYSWRLHRHPFGGGFRHTLWVALSRKPGPDVVSFLHDEGFILTWSTKSGGLTFASGSRARWEALI